MNKDNTKPLTCTGMNVERAAESQLIKNFIDLLDAHQKAFKQTRTFRRMCLLAMGVMFAFARHTVSQGIMSVGMAGRDWTAWYRLFQGKRFSEERLNRCLVQETLAHAPQDAPYMTVVDITHVQRSSMKMPGTSWARAAGTAMFNRGLSRAQRFLTCGWLPPIVNGFTRAIPIRFLAAFTEKAKPAAVGTSKDWQAVLVFVNWMRGILDQAQRTAQMLVVLADGAFDKTELWKALPARVVLIVRTAKNRVLHELPGPYSGKGRRRKYGERAPTPQAYLHNKRKWQKSMIAVRGRSFEVQWQLAGCFLRASVANVPVYLLVLRGVDRKISRGRQLRREPAFFLINAVLRDGTWQMPYAPDLVLSWLWQRWEIEVTHRDLKAGFGVGQIQCWNTHSAVLSVQWMVWLFGLMMLTGYRTWGWFGASAFKTAWWQGPRRWSFNTLWRHFRVDLWKLDDFRAVCASSSPNQPKYPAASTSLFASIIASARA